MNWIKQVAELTNVWVNGQTRKWKSGKWSDSVILQLKKRLSEIFLIRSQHDELLRLLALEDRERLNVESTFKPFRSIHALYCGSKYSQDEWEESQKQYQSNMQPIEGEIVAKLRKEIFAEKLNSTQLLREFRRWRGLLDFPTIKNAFLAERESLLKSLIAEASSMKEEFESRAGMKVNTIPGLEEPPESKYSSKFVAAIIWARQLFGKLQCNFRMGQNLLADLKQAPSYVKLAQEVVSAIKEYETFQFKKWAESIKEQLEDPTNPLALDMAGKFMEIKAGAVEVKYSDRLGVLIREVRQLKELELKIPKEIEKVAEDAKKYYKQAVALKQIADFYNNMGSQIIPSQSPMLLQLAMKFEEILISPENEGVSWENTTQLDKYIARLRGAAEELMNENRKLRRIHEAVTDMVADLLSADLGKNIQRWKEIMEKVKNTVDSVCRNQDQDVVQKWLLHWDHQLYKVLQYHYVSGLHSLSDILSTFNVEIVYASKQVSYNPSLEELKSKYYREIKAFISIPLNFTGLGSSVGLFKKMIDANANSLQVIYVNAEVFKLF